jgi:hypothetical protein
MIFTIFLGVCFAVTAENSEEEDAYRRPFTVP